MRVYCFTNLFASRRLREHATAELRVEGGLGWKFGVRPVILIDMNPLTKAAVGLGAVLALCLAAWIPLRGFLQFRAEYPGGLAFIGQADGLLGTEYVRLHLWRTPSETSPLPDFTVHIHGEPYRLAELSPETMRALGGMPNEGGLKDAADYSLQYRFEDGRLTYLSIYPAWRARGTPAPSAREGRFRIQAGDGPSFLLPISHRELLTLAGSPKRVWRNIAN